MFKECFVFIMNNECLVLIINKKINVNTVTVFTEVGRLNMHTK